MPKRHAPKQKYQMRRERFLSEMEQVVPWSALLEAGAVVLSERGGSARASAGGSGAEL